MKASAWILPITHTLFIAMGEFELIHILPDQPTLFDIPKSPSYCKQVIVWQNKIIPIMDLATRFHHPEQKPSELDHYVIGIFAYREETTNLPGYGALFMAKTPFRCEVENSQRCSLPEHFELWQHYVHSCFLLESTNEAIPIVKLNRLFSIPDQAV